MLKIRFPQLRYVALLCVHIHHVGVFLACEQEYRIAHGITSPFNATTTLVHRSCTCSDLSISEAAIESSSSFVRAIYIFVNHVHGVPALAQEAVRGLPCCLHWVLKTILNLGLDAHLN